MKIEIQRNESSLPIVYENVINAYIKGLMYCILFVNSEGKRVTHKYPMCSILVIEDMIGQLAYYIGRSWRKLPMSRVINEYCPDETPDTVTDDFSSISAWCPDCGQKTMEVVRPGSYQCSNCG